VREAEGADVYLPADRDRLIPRRRELKGN